MPRYIAERAVVVGAGIAGLSAAAALSTQVREVVVLERDELARNAARKGTPQARHTHVLLAGGLQALTELMPGLEGDLVNAGAVQMRAGLDLRVERPGFDPFPLRDLGWHVFGMSRRLVEAAMRCALARRRNVGIRQRCRVQHISTDGRTGAARAVRFHDGEDRSQVCHADLIIDATGTGALTRSFLGAHGYGCPPRSTTAADIHYATALFEAASPREGEWKSVTVYPDSTPNSMRGVLLPLEDDLWSVSLGAAHYDRLPATEQDFLACVSSLRTQTIGRALQGARRVSAVARYAFPVGTRHHYDRLARFPGGLLPLGDAIARLNPICAQGMSLAAMQAAALSRILSRRASAGVTLAGLGREFFAEIRPMVETRCATAAQPAAQLGTSADWPADFDASPAFHGALTRVAAREPAIHQLMLQVQHLLQPSSAYREPQVAALIAAEMARAA